METVEERVAKIESNLSNINEKVSDIEKKANALHKRIDEIVDQLHRNEIDVTKEIHSLKILIEKLSNDIKWYGKIPTLIVSLISLIATVSIILKVWGVVK